MSLHNSYYENRGANPDDIAEPRKLTDAEIEQAEFNAHDAILFDNDRYLLYTSDDECIKAIRDVYEACAKDGNRDIYTIDEYAWIIKSAKAFHDVLYRIAVDDQKDKILEDNPNG